MKTTVFLQRIGVLSSSSSVVCCFFKSTDEIVVHVLLHCPFVREVWSNLLRWWGPGSVEGVLHWWEGQHLKKLEKKLWRAIPLAILCSI